MVPYLEIVVDILSHGTFKENRTGVGAYTLPGMMFKHTMAKGFPLLTTKFVPIKLVASELEGFIKGITDKKWFQEKGNHIWDEWCNPMRVPYSTDEDTKEKMMAETDLGPIYGSQWRNFDGTPLRDGVDQLKRVIETLKTNPNDRRMIVSAWNPRQLHQMALPPCHYSFQVTVDNGFLNLAWNQRSVDVALGLPFNIASYALLLLLFCEETGYKPGHLIGFLMDTHIYENHVDGMKEQLIREPKPLPKVHIVKEVGPDGFSILNWSSDDILLIDYQYHPKINFEIAV